MRTGRRYKMIKLEKLNKYYYKNKSNENHVLNDISIDLPETGLVSFLGPSGCGKTTLLNAIGGLDKLNSGKVYIDDECISKKRSGKIDTLRNAKIGYIFQNFNLLDDRTVYENVALALRMIGIKDEKIIDERVRYCLEAVGIYKFRKRRADALSGGQRQRVAIARAIVKNPRIIIADEPTGNLDSANTLEVMNIIKAISKERLVLLVTHEKKIAEFYSDRIIELKDGKIISDRLNDSTRYLDYQLENKIYLKDMNVQKSFSDDDVKVDVFSNEEHKAEIKIVIRGGNLYIDTDNKYNVVSDDSNIEMIDDHYRVIDSETYDKHSFEYDKHLPKNFKAKYTSLYTPFNNVVKGFKSIRKFNKGKKILLIGFFFAAMFSFLAVSNIVGLMTVKTEDYISTNKHYLTATNSSKNEEIITKASGVSGVKYVIPGNSKATLSLMMNDYYQTATAIGRLEGSIALSKVLDKDDIIKGEYKGNDNEIVLDKLIAKRFLKAKSGKNAGVIHYSDFIGKRISLGGNETYIISAISDTGSLSFYVSDNSYIDILSQLEIEKAQGDPSKSDMLKDYSRAQDITIKKGRAPTNLYEVIVNESQQDEFELNKTISTKVNDHPLKVVGYYKSSQIGDFNYVSSETLRAGYIGKQKVISIYADDPIKVKDELSKQGINANINIDEERAKYDDSRHKSVITSLILAAVILTISLIEMYLMLRSSFLSRLKEVGIMRAIGIKKRDITTMFAGEIIAINLITVIPGIAFMYYIWSNIIKISDTLAKMYAVNPAVAIITFAMLMFFNLIIGLIPVASSMRKTPAEMLARTDI